MKQACAFLVAELAGHADLGEGSRGEVHGVAEAPLRLRQHRLAAEGLEASMRPADLLDARRQRLQLAGHARQVAVLERRVDPPEPGPQMCLRVRALPTEGEHPLGKPLSFIEALWRRARHPASAQGSPQRGPVTTLFSQRQCVDACGRGVLVEIDGVVDRPGRVHACLGVTRADLRSQGDRIGGERRERVRQSRRVGSSVAVGPTACAASAACASRSGLPASRASAAAVTLDSSPPGSSPHRCSARASPNDSRHSASGSRWPCPVERAIRYNRALSS